MSLTIWYQPRLTVLSVPSFTNPAHLPTTFLGESTPIEQLAEYAGRVCYMSQANPGKKTTGAYLTHILEQAHGSVLEHGMISLLLEGVSRSLTHELIRHRVGTAVSQLSQRYVDASETAFVCPPIIQPNTPAFQAWRFACLEALLRYTELADALEAQLRETMLAPMNPVGWGARKAHQKQVREAARAVLPNCVETKLVWSCNVRELRHVLLLRGGSGADPEIQQWARALLATCQPLVPHALGDLVVDPETQIIVSRLGGSPHG